jgi:hypothetical protein
LGKGKDLMVVRRSAQHATLSASCLSKSGNSLSFQQAQVRINTSQVT